MLKSVLTRVVDGALTPDAFTTEARAEMTPARLRQLGEALKPIGTITAVTLGGRTEEDGVYSYRRYRLVGNGGPRWCRVLLTSDDKIARLELPPK